MIAVGIGCGLLDIRARKEDRPRTAYLPSIPSYPFPFASLYITRCPLIYNLNPIFYCQSNIQQPMITTIFPQPSGSPSKNQIKFPEDIQVILRADRPSIGNLYIGNVEAATNKIVIQTLQIGAILCVAKGYATKHPKELVPHTKYAAIEDSQNADLGAHLDQCVNFINQKLKITNVLIHCVAGTNRSACFAIAFLVKCHSLSVEDAFSEVKSRRKVICPSENMMAQLKKYERKVMCNGSAVSQARSGVSQARSGVSQVPEIKLTQASFLHDLAPSVRIKTNLDRSNFLQVQENRSLNNSKLSNNRLKVEQFDDRKSCMSQRSARSKVSNTKINISINQPKQSMKNPEESFISKSKNSVLNKSFYAPSQRNKSQISEIHQLPTDLPLKKKTSSSREQFQAKVRHIDSLNTEINEKISVIHQKFQHDHQSHRMNLQAQLNEISQLRSNLQSDRLSKLASRRQLHDKTMQNHQAQQYITYLPLATSNK